MDSKNKKALYEEAKEIAEALNLDFEPFTLASICEEAEAENEKIQSLATYLFYENDQVDLHRELNDPRFTKKMADWFKKEMEWEKKAMGWV